MDYCDYAYKMENSFDMDGIRQFLKLCHVYKRIEGLENPRILDVGSGYSEIFLFLIQNGVKFTYDAVDISKKSQEDINFYQFDLTSEKDVPFRDNSYDVILLLDVLQNILPRHGERLLGETSRLLNQGGQVIISTRNVLVPPEKDKEHHVCQLNINNLIDNLWRRGLIIENTFGINYGNDEAEAEGLKEGSLLEDFLPSRFHRAIVSLDDWKNCKFVMLDAIKK